MKVIIQIPCFNESASLPITLAQLPRVLEGVDKVEWLVIDDGSTDNTAEVARSHGVDHVVSHHKNRGLAAAFVTGVQACLDLGADIIVNTDADNQYDASCIPSLVGPILQKKAEIVIGARPIDNTDHFSMTKKLLQKLGSWTVRMASKTDIPDAPSGFRAFSREAASKLNVFTSYTYTLETIIQAGQKDIPITWIPVKTNPDIRESRLIKSIPEYVIRSFITIMRIWVVYQPFRFFFNLGLVLMALGVLLSLRFLWFYIMGEGDGHIQSLILTSILIVVGFQAIMFAFIADLQNVNRKLLEDLQYKYNSLVKKTDRDPAKEK